MRVDIVADTEENLRKWLGLCESQLRTFIEGVEKKTDLLLHACASLCHAILTCADGQSAYPGGTRQNDGLGTGIVGRLRPRD